MEIGDKVRMTDSFYKGDVGKTGTIKNLYTDSQGRKCADFYPDCPDSEEDNGLWVAFEDQLEKVE